MNRPRPHLSSAGRAPGRSHAGFTLVEVLVAMTIMAIIAVMCWQGVDGIVRARNASQHRLEQVLRLNTVIAQWEQDLANLQESPAVPGFAFDGGTVRMTRRADKGLQVVTWSLMPAPEGSAGGGGVWLRWAGPVGDGVHYGSVSTADGVVYTLDSLGCLDAFDASTGVPLLHRPVSVDSGQLAAGLTSSGVAIARHTVYVEAGNAVVAYRAA